MLRGVIRCHSATLVSEMFDKMLDSSEANASDWREAVSLFQFRKGDYLIVLYRTFIDDSADERREDVVTAGAVIATQGQWNTVRREWQKRLQRDGLRYFRSTEYYSFKGEFSRYRDHIKYAAPKGSEAAKALRDDLEIILRDSHVIGMGVAIPIKLYNEFRATVPGADRKFLPDAFASAMQLLMLECAYSVRDELPGADNRIGFVSDDSSRAGFYAQVYADFRAKNSDIGSMMGGLVHLNDKLHPPLQAADMLASLTKEHALPCLADLSSKKPTSGISLTPLRLEGVVHKIFIWDYDFMDKLLQCQPE